MYTLVLNDALNDHFIGFPSAQKSTTEYFQDLAGVGPSQTGENLMKANPEYVLGPGMDDPAPNWGALTAEHHGWKVAVGQTTATPAGTTFMVSKNWVPLFVEPASKNRLSPKQVAATPGKDKRRAIVIQHGGAAKVVTVGRDLMAQVNGKDRVTLLPE